MSMMRSSTLCKTSVRLAIAAGVLMMAAAYAPQVQAGSIGHHTGMSSGPTIGPSVHVVQGRTHGHDGPKQAPPYVYDQSGHVHTVHHYDRDWRPNGPVSATTNLKPR